MTFLVQLLIVIVAAKAAAELCHRIGVPTVVGEIVVGIILGPSVLGVLSPDVVLTALGGLGVLLLLFDVGTEMDVADLRLVGRAAITVGVIGVAVPFALGAAVVLAFGLSGNQALFVGAAMTATSVGITARVFGDLKALATIEARTVLGAAVADDVIGLVILTVVVRLVTVGTISPIEVARVVAIALAFLVVTTAIGSKYAPSAFDWLARKSRSNGTLVAAAVAFMVGMAALAEWAKLAPIVGAFIAGVALSKARSAPQIRREMAPLGHLLIPVFFLEIGVDVDVAQFARPAVLGLASALLVIAVIGKLVAPLGMIGSPGDKLAVGIAMIPRGEVGLIFAAVGMQQHVFGENVYASVLLVVLVTTLMTPPLLRWRLSRVSAN
ncbi:MAG: cation:proton antiporter [Actinomycetes bacterium]